MATTAASYRTSQPAPTLVSTVHSMRPPVKFDAAFIERRMRLHKAMQEEKAAEDAAEIVTEVVRAFGHVLKVSAQSRNQKRLTK